MQEKDTKKIEEMSEKRFAAALLKNIDKVGDIKFV